MTIPKIEHIEGSRDTESITLMCTGCSEVYSYSVRQYKGDFGCNISEFEQFLRWAKWNAAQHECFLAGRIGYLVETEYDIPDVDPLDIDHGPPFAESGEDLLGGMFPERHEDPWGGVGYVVEPLEESARELQEWLNGEDYWPSLDDDDSPDFEPDCLTCGAHSWTFVDGDCPKCNPPITESEFDLLAIVQFEHSEDPWGERWLMAALDSAYPEDADDDEDDLDAWMDEELDLPPRPLDLDAAMTLDFRRLYEMQPGEWPDLDDEEEEAFGFLYGEPTEFKTHGTVTGRINVRHPTLQEIPRVYSFPIEIDYAAMEQRIVDRMLLDVGVYSLDNLGCLRDEKGRCLACLRPGPHLPFYWERK